MKRAKRDKVTAECVLTQEAPDAWEACYVKTTTKPGGEEHKETLVREKGKDPEEAKRKVFAALRSAGLRVPKKVSLGKPAAARRGPQKGTRGKAAPEGAKPAEEGGRGKGKGKAAK